MRQRESLFDERGLFRVRGMIVEGWGQAADGLLLIGEGAMPSVLGLMERREARARQELESWTEVLEQARVGAGRGERGEYTGFRAVWW